MGQHSLSWLHSMTRQLYFCFERLRLSENAMLCKMQKMRFLQVPVCNYMALASNLHRSDSLSIVFVLIHKSAILVGF